ncbi:hypothetical protein XPA_006024 [Xanthoria parietina]
MLKRRLQLPTACAIRPQQSVPHTIRTLISRSSKTSTSTWSIPRDHRSYHLIPFCGGLHRTCAVERPAACWPASHRRCIPIWFLMPTLSIGRTSSSTCPRVPASSRRLRPYSAIRIDPFDNIIIGTWK